MAVAEIQSDVICATSLIAHAICRMANLAGKSEEKVSFLLVDTLHNHGISRSGCIFFFYILSGTSTSVYCFDREGELPGILEVSMTGSTISVPKDMEKQ